MAGFTWRYNLSGGPQLVYSYVVANDEVLTAGEMVNLESGEADAGATADTALIGSCLESLDNADDGLSVRVTANPDAVYGVTDANARLAGATLDLATGALGVTTDSNSDVIVVKDSAATEETLVAFAGTHYLQL